MKRTSLSLYLLLGLFVFALAASPILAFAANTTGVEDNRITRQGADDFKPGGVDPAKGEKGPDVGQPNPVVENDSMTRTGADKGSPKPVAPGKGDSGPNVGKPNPAVEDDSMTRK